MNPGPNERTDTAEERYDALARQLQESRRRECALRDFIETAATSLHWVGADGTILWANQAELDLLGYAKEKYIGRNIAEFHADQPVIRDMLVRLGRAETLHDVPARLLHCDGSVRHVLISSSALFENGKFVHTRCFTRDVTALKPAQDAGLLLGAIVDSSDDAIISKDLYGVVTSWNKSAERLFGYTEAEAIGRTVAELLVPEDRREEEPEILARLKRGERVDHFETVRRRKDGSLIDISLTVSPVRDARGLIIGASKIARDITRRKENERRLVEQAHLLALSGDAILVRDGQDRILDWNRGAEEMYGFTREEALGQVSHELLRTEFPESLPRTLEILFRDGSWSGELIHTCRAGSRIVTLSRWVAERDGKGGVIRVLESNNDITQRVDAQAQLRRANEDLEQFAFTASHDLQEPLRTIKIYSELLVARHAATPLEGGSAKFLEFLHQAASRMELLISDLLSYTQVTRLAPPDEVIDANEALSAALANLSAAVIESGASVEADKLPKLQVHSTHLRQLFQNLIGNAIKYRSPDRRPSVHISAGRQDGMWIFTVRDNGIGIEPQYKEQIFGVFSRLHNADSYEGTGIGLAICQRIVERYHGRIWVESEFGCGSAFCFTLRA